MGMKGVFDSWRSFSANPITIDEQLLIESRYTDAVASATNWKKIIDRDVMPHIKPEALEIVTDAVTSALKAASEADPSGKNKYLPWFAKYLKDWTKETFRRLSPRLSAAAQATLEAGNELLDTEDATSLGRYIREHGDRLVRALPKFHKYSERGLIRKSIDEFEDTYEIQTAVYEAEREETRRDQMERMREEARSTTEYIEDTDDYGILRPESEEAACYFGQGTKWCIAATEAYNHFNDYRDKGAAFYFVTFKHIPQDFDDRKLALVYDPNSYGEPDTVWDRADDQVDTSGIYNAARLNVFYKGLNGIDSYKKLKKKDPEQFAEEAGYDFAQEALEGLSEGQGGIEFWRLWAEGYGLDLTEINLDDLTELESLVDELVDEQSGDIIGLTAQHHQDNPGGPDPEDFDRKLGEYDFAHLWAQHHLYDGYSSWDAGTIFEPDVEEESVLDEEKFVTAIEKILDEEGIYVDGAEWDRHDEVVRIEFKPDDYREADGLEGYENFLDRMADYDRKLEDIMRDEKALRAAYVEHGAIWSPDVQKYVKVFEDLELDNFEVEYDNEEVSFSAQLRPRIEIPQWILDTPDPQAVLNDVFTFLERHGHTRKLIGDRVVGVLEDTLSQTLDDLTKQMELPFGGDKEAAEKREEETWQKAAQEMGFGRDDNVNVLVLPRADSAGFRGAHVEEEGGKKYVVPKWYITIDLIMNMEHYGGFEATEEDAQIVMNFAKYVDQQEVFNKIQQLLQVTITKALNNIDYSELSDPQYQLGVADVQERQIQEIHKLLNPSYETQHDTYKEKADALMREVFNN